MFSSSLFLYYLYLVTVRSDEFEVMKRENPEMAPRSEGLAALGPADYITRAEFCIDFQNKLEDDNDNFAASSLLSAYRSRGSVRNSNESVGQDFIGISDTTILANPLWKLFLEEARFWAHRILRQDRSRASVSLSPRNWLRFSSESALPCKSSFFSFRRTWNTSAGSSDSNPLAMCNLSSLVGNSPELNASPGNDLNSCPSISRTERFPKV
ncbi:hypothetical protein C0J52_24098 [Blattella germanica]|nr:hypothetical protein C0J52_24098 [Blattella germanica]